MPVSRNARRGIVLASCISAKALMVSELRQSHVSIECDQPSRRWDQEWIKSMPQNVATGRCLCGNIKFETPIEPLWVAHCHCESCRRNTGAPVATFVGMRNDDVSWDGERRIYASSPGTRRGFCSDCGTPLTYEADRHPGEVHFYVSVFDDPGMFSPEVHVHFRERIPWLELSDDLPRFAEMSDGNEPDSWGPKSQKS
jgi:hypothetical protein